MKAISKLRAKLLVEQKYDRLSKPVKDHKAKIHLFMIVHLFQIVDLSSTGILKTNFLLMSTWDDEHLVWNESEYKINSLRFNHHEIWKPDLVIWNYEKGNAWDAFDDNDLIVDANGTVTWDSLTHSITYCSLDLSEYPFDKQTCDIQIGPWTYNSDDLNITSSKTFEGPYYSNGEWSVVKKEAIISNLVVSVVELQITLLRRTTIYTYFIVLPYLISVLFILIMMIAELSPNQNILFAGCSIFIQICLIMFIISHIGFFWTVKAPRAIRCMSINIFFTICTICLSIFLSIKNETMKSRQLPFFIETLLTNQIIGKIFILNLDSKRSDSNLMPFVNEEENERTNDDSIEINEEIQEPTNQLTNILVIEKKGLTEGELYNLKKWTTFRTLIDRLLLYIYLIILVVFHI